VLTKDIKAVRAYADNARGHRACLWVHLVGRIVELSTRPLAGLGDATKV
jgi:hypothetical protein